MEIIEYLLSIDLNYIVIGLMVIFFSLEQLLNTQFSFKNRGEHLWQSFLFQVVFVIVNIFWTTLFVFAVEYLNQHEIGLFFLILTLFQILHHSNLRFPSWLDKTLGLVFTTPNLHKIHHEQDQYYTDSNFADIFILWDRIFGTYKYKPVDQIKFGLAEFDEANKQTFWYLIRSPFIRIKRIEKGGAENRN